MAEQLYATMVEISNALLQAVALELLPGTHIENATPTKDASLQIMTKTLDQTLVNRPGSSGQVTTLTAELNDLKENRTR
ncbi:hypothetical protein C1H46_036895 [Malus baccata]|uniref:Uncharacterized protein n=1 Tax=Malus baccata TaxID=106549 RepID=A0A540KU88_MALBA|nr:hypothetical protein C1H46_036895 [Malus baccata]